MVPVQGPATGESNRAEPRRRRRLSTRHLGGAVAVAAVGSLAAPALAQASVTTNFWEGTICAAPSTVKDEVRTPVWIQGFVAGDSRCDSITGDYIGPQLGWDRAWIHNSTNNSLLSSTGVQNVGYIATARWTVDGEQVKTYAKLAGSSWNDYWHFLTGGSVRQP